MRLSTSILQRCCCAIPTAKPFVYRLSAYTVSFCRRCFAMLQRIIQIPLTILCFRATLSLQSLFLHVYCGLAISILSCWFKFCYFWCYLCIVPKHAGNRGIDLCCVHNSIFFYSIVCGSVCLCIRNMRLLLRAPAAKSSRACLAAAAFVYSCYCLYFAINSLSFSSETPKYLRMFSSAYSGRCSMKDRI